MIDIFSTLSQAAKNYPNRLAIDGPTKITYSDLETSSIQVASFLRQQGVEPGTLVLIDLPEALAIAVEWACWYSGFILCDYRQDAEYDFKDNQVLVSTRVKGSSIKTIEITQRTLAEVSNSSPGGGKPFLYNDSDLAQVLMSSGTSGKPKAVGISADKILARAKLGEHAWALNKPVMCTMTKGTVAWTNYKIFSVLNGQTILISTSQTQAVDLAEKYQVKTVMTSPITLKGLLDELDQKAKTLPALETIFVGGGVTPSKLAKRAESHAGVMNIYGSTEAGSISATIYNSNSRSVGTPFEDVELQIVNEDGQPVPSGELGELRYKRPSMADGYLNSETGIIDGWFYPGDLASIDHNDELLIQGRTSETVSIGGVKVSLLDYDRVFESIPTIEDVATFSFEHNDQIQIGVAVVAGEGFNPESLSNEVYSRSPVPKIASVFQVSEIPRNANGKNQREKLAEEFSGKLSN